MWLRGCTRVEVLEERLRGDRRKCRGVLGTKRNKEVPFRLLPSLYPTSLHLGRLRALWTGRSFFARWAVAGCGPSLRVQSLGASTLSSSLRH